MQIKEEMKIEAKMILSREEVACPDSMRSDDNESETTLISSIICQKAKELIEGEIGSNMKDFDMQRMMDTMQEQDFTDFGLHWLINT